MIRIIKDIYFVSLDDSDDTPIRLPFIPASGEYKETTEPVDSGLVNTVEVGFKIRHLVSGIYDNLKMIIFFEDGRSVSIGSEDLPVRLKVETESVIKVSCKYQRIG
ncbi:MAG: hypothetical protein OSJ55_07590 [Bacteroidales bacterium]|nr:hypothetical protein [Bacteroidales bacterium]